MKSSSVSRRSGVGRDGDARRNLHTALLRQQRLQIAHDTVEGAGPAFVWPQPIVCFARAIKADRHGKPEAFEEVRVRCGEGVPLVVIEKFSAMPRRRANLPRVASPPWTTGL